MVWGFVARAGRDTTRRTLGALIVVAVAAALLAGCGSGSSEPVGPTPRVAGQMIPPPFGGDWRDQAALATMTISDVWCRWNGDRVEVGATFQNGLHRRLRMVVNPYYSLITPSPSSFAGGLDAGEVQEFILEPRETLEWHAIVGRPDEPPLPPDVHDRLFGKQPIPPPIVGRPEITSCVPQLFQAQSA